jgi:hypothetical protein
MRLLNCTIFSGKEKEMRLFNNRGENEGSDKGEGSEKVFKQEDVDRIINKRFADYKTLQEQNADLIKFKSEHEKQQDVIKQKQLEEQGAYEEAKKTYEGKIGELSNVLSQKDQAIRDMRIGYTLQAEINNQNAVPEVADLIKGSAVIHTDGSIRIKGKDSNGLETLLPIEQGVADFLKAKPYLVKAGKQGGSGSITDINQGNTGTSGKEDLASLNQQLQAAMSTRDYKASTEIAAKIRKQQALAGISSHS